MTLLSLALISALAPVQFPKDFVGVWKGDLNWGKPGVSEVSHMPTTLTIQPKQDGTYTYQLKYGETPLRDYLLRAKDEAKGLWVIDEGQGVLLDQVWIDECLTGAFGVGKATVISRLRKEGKNLIMEMITHENTASYTSPAPNEVSVFRITGTQRVVLKPAKS